MARDRTADLLLRTGFAIGAILMIRSRFRRSPAAQNPFGCVDPPFACWKVGDGKPVWSDAQRSALKETVERTVEGAWTGPQTLVAAKRVMFVAASDAMRELCPDFPLPAHRLAVPSMVEQYGAGWSSFWGLAHYYAEQAVTKRMGQ